MTTMGKRRSASRGPGHGRRPWAHVRDVLPQTTLRRIDAQMAAFESRFAQLSRSDLASDPLNDMAGCLRDGELRDGADIDRYLYGEK